MVTFTETGFTVAVETGVNPIEAWLDTHNEMVDALQSEDENKQSYRYHYLELMRNMMPDYDTALRLTKPRVHETITRVANEAPPQQCQTWEGEIKLRKL